MPFRDHVCFFACGAHFLLGVCFLFGSGREGLVQDLEGGMAWEGGWAGRLGWSGAACGVGLRCLWRTPHAEQVHGSHCTTQIKPKKKTWAHAPWKQTPAKNQEITAMNRAETLAFEEPP